MFHLSTPMRRIAPRCAVGSNARFWQSLSSRRRREHTRSPLSSRARRRRRQCQTATTHPLRIGLRASTRHAANAKRASWYVWLGMSFAPYVDASSRRSGTTASTSSPSASSTRARESNLVSSLWRYGAVRRSYDALASRVAVTRRAGASSTSHWSQLRSSPLVSRFAKSARFWEYRVRLCTSDWLALCDSRIRYVGEPSI